GLFHEKLAKAWAQGRRGVDLIRRALVLIADHELNASTFAARVAASTGASLPAAALAGYATLTGPLHGEAATRALAFFEAAERDGPGKAVKAPFFPPETPPAIGHALYPQGDPRAASLLAAMKPRAAIAEAIAAAESALGAKPNIDLALAALTVQLGLPAEAPF